MLLVIGFSLTCIRASPLCEGHYQVAVRLWVNVPHQVITQTTLAQLQQSPKVYSKSPPHCVQSHDDPAGSSSRALRDWTQAAEWTLHVCRAPCEQQHCFHTLAQLRPTSLMFF